MAKKEFKLRDIYANHIGEPDIGFLQRKVSAGAEMKTAIKRLLSEVDLSSGGPDHNLFHVSRGRLIALREAMEGWCNVV